MATYYETILPTGRAIRYKALQTRGKLEIDKAVGPEGTTEDVMKQTVVRCVVAYTKPLDVVHKEETRTVQKDGANVEVKVRVADVDAMLEAATEKKLWIDATPQTFAVEGDTNFYEVFDNVFDFQVALAAIQNASGAGMKDAGLLAGKARTVSVGP
jgi:hypothetical protein